jgi:hypothetical protein
METKSIPKQQVFWYRFLQFRWLFVAVARIKSLHRCNCHGICVLLVNGKVEGGIEGQCIIDSAATVGIFTIDRSSWDRHAQRGRD